MSQIRPILLLTSGLNTTPFGKPPSLSCFAKIKSINMNILFSYLPSQSTSSMHLLHPVQHVLHIMHPAALILQTPCAPFRQHDHDLTQQWKHQQTSLLHFEQHSLHLFLLGRSVASTPLTITSFLTAEFSLSPSCSVIGIHYTKNLIRGGGSKALRV